MSPLPLTGFIMGIFDFIWGQNDPNSLPGYSPQRNDGWIRQPMNGTSFVAANATIRITECNSSKVIGQMRVESGIVEMLESSIESFIQGDYDFEKIPANRKMSHFPLEYQVSLPPTSNIKCKESKSDEEYTTKMLWSMGTGFTVQGKVNILIDKVYFEHREIDGQLIEGSQSFHYTQPRVILNENEMWHWMYFD
jgi:hypothetical protein